MTIPFLKPNPSSGVPIYLQLMEQVKHAVETGALRVGDQLPGIRTVAEALVVNPNTVAKAYRELEHEGVLEVRHGAGAFVASAPQRRPVSDRVRLAQPLARALVAQLRDRGLTEDEARRLCEAEIVRAYAAELLARQSAR